MSSPFHSGTHFFTVPAKNLTLEYVVRQPSTLPNCLVVVQCPGWGLGSLYLQRGLSDLWEASPSFTVVFFHPRGTAGSSRPRDETEMRTMPDMASDLDDLRSHLGLDQYPVLLGHSNGGAIALSYAEMYPDRVQRLILLNHQVVGFRDRSQLQRESIRHDPRYQGAWKNRLHRRIETDEEFTASVNGLWPLYFFDPQQYVQGLIRDIGDQPMSVWCYQNQGRCDESLENPMQMMDRLRNVRAKTLMIFGRDDLICGMKIAERTKEGIPDSQAILYDACGHFPWIEQKERTLADIRGFIQGKMKSQEPATVH
ncbi:uncharacterized protein PFLUO_LOCUS2254 [Penicillium psychrofluorescens]|uniref:uncharacterized protein n=1 Tax=Penicillium psychrofluorescens TaxID=3158075 RepID=UPI003CCE19DC